MLTFAIAALALVMVPGPDQALITRNALLGGRRGGVFTMLGGALGLTLHASAAGIGLSALLVASAAAFTVLKIVGVGYLLWLAVHMLRQAKRDQVSPGGQERALPRSSWTYLRHGFLSNALNPKVALFFVTFLPQFVPVDSASPRTEALLLSFVFALLYLSWFSIYICAVQRLGRWLRKPRVSARIEQLSGVGLLGVAAKLAVATH